nr:reverse transcriptase domain-containing protein [Tanacetum cinerariifolium]
MIAYLTKSDASEGFNQIIDFLNGRSIKWWVTEATIRDALRLDDAEGVECLPNEEIFAELARMGYEKPSTKLTFYKAFFSIQWKFSIRTILQCMSAKRTSWNVFSSSMASAVICLFSGKGFSGVKTPLFEGMIVEQQIDEEVDEGADEVPVGDVNTAEGGVSAANDEIPTVDEEPSIPSPTPPTSPQQPSQDIPSTSQVQPTPPQSPQVQPPSLPPQQQPTQEIGIPMNLFQDLMDTCTALTRRVEHLEQDKVTQAMEITKLKIEISNNTVMDDVSNQGRMIAEMDADADVVLEEDKDVAADIVQEVVVVVTTAKLITEVVTAASITITTAEAQVSAATLTVAPSRVIAAPSRRRKGVVIRDPQEEFTTSTIIPAETKSKDKGKWILVAEPKPLKKQAQIEQDEKYARELKAELNINIDWDEAIDHVNRKAKEDPANVAGFKMDYFKGMSYDDIRPIFEAKFNINVAFLQNIKEHIKEEESRALKRLNETLAEKAAKRQKLDEEVEELKRHLQIVPNEEDDVYTEATPLARKVLVVDYEIINQNNKPYYKIKRADDTHQLYLSFLTLLKNFDREDLESLWSLVKERFATTKPKNFSDDFLLVTLGAIKSQELETVGIMWCADNQIYNNTADFVSREKGDILLLEAFLNDDLSLHPPTQGMYLPQIQKEIKICEAKKDKSLIDEPPEVELKDLPPHLEYLFLEGDDKFPVIISKDLSVEEKVALIKVLKSHKQAIAWKLFDIKGIDPEFFTHKILMEDDFKPAV